MKDTSNSRFARRAGLKTYSHFKNLGRMPSEYEIVSTKLTYNTQGFAVHTPVTQWYERYRDASPLKCSDWDKFADPRQTVYRRYNEIQFRQETYLDFTLERIEEDRSDLALTPQWLDVLRLMLGPYRFPSHAKQMMASYYCHIAPSSRITNCAAFQAADEMRMVQRLAYRVTQLNLAVGGFGEKDRSTWEDHAVWQPLRLCMEKMLTAWDWAESFVALNVVLKPQLDALYLTEFADLAVANKDARLSDFLYSFTQDAQWHRDWTRALVRTALDDRPDNEAVIARWVEKWMPMAQDAIVAFAPIFETLPAATSDFQQHWDSISSRYSSFLKDIGLKSIASGLDQAA